jgi:uncharacterized protein (TIGR02266 family)
MPIMRTAKKPEASPQKNGEWTHSGTIETVVSRRAHERVDVKLEVTMESESNFYMGLTENLSEGGLFIATHLLQPIGTPVTVVLKLPNAPQPITINGTVRWVRQYSETSDTEPGVGVRFEQLPAEHTEFIRVFLATRAPLFHDED